MPRRHRIVLGAIVAFLVLGSAIGTVMDRPAVQPLPPIAIVATATPRTARSAVPVQAMAPPEARRPVPTATLAPTVAPLPAVVVVVEAAPEQSIVVSQAAAPAPVIEGIHERASDKPGPPSR